MASTISPTGESASNTPINPPDAEESTTTTVALAALDIGSKQPAAKLPTQAEAHHSTLETESQPSDASQPQSGGAAASTKVEPPQYYSSERIKNPHDLPTVRQLFDRYNCCWTGEDYRNLPYSRAEARNLLHAHNVMFADRKVAQGSHGVLKKKIVPAGTQIFVRADLHGDLKSLMANLRALQQKGLLDENFKCKEGVQLIFLGDYIDRGVYGMPIMMLLAALEMENPDQVTLIRGNHEYPDMSICFCAADEPLTNFWLTNETILTRFCETMPLSVYVATENEEPLQFVHFTHGTLDLVDLAPMLDGDIDQMDVPTKISDLPDRIREILPGSPLFASAQQVRLLYAFNAISYRAKQEKHLSAFNWGDVGQETELASLGKRSYCFSPTDLKHLFNVSAKTNKVYMMFRGHQHNHEHGIVSKAGVEEIVVSTLPVGPETAAYGGDEDCAYILTTAPEVKGWGKYALRRKAKTSAVHGSGPKPIQDGTL